MNNFSHISIYYGSHPSNREVDDVGRANNKACHNELDQKQVVHKTKQYSNKRQTSIEVKVSKLLSVFFISIFDNFNNVLKGTGIVIQFSSIRDI